MNTAQKTLLMFAAIVVGAVLHFWFCRWDADAPYAHNSEMLIFGDEPRAISSWQIVGSNKPDSNGFHSHVRFTGVAARNGTPTTAVIGGLIAPFVLLVLAFLPFLTPDRRAAFPSTR